MSEEVRLVVNSKEEIAYKMMVKIVGSGARDEIKILETYARCLKVVGSGSGSGSTGFVTGTKEEVAYNMMVKIVGSGARDEDKILKTFEKCLAVVSGGKSEVWLM